MDDRGSLALRASQDNIHKVTCPGHRLDLLEIIDHHGCWLSWDVCKVRKSEGRVGIHALFFCVRRPLSVSWVMVGQGRSRGEKISHR